MSTPWCIELYQHIFGFIIYNLVKITAYNNLEYIITESIGTNYIVWQQINC